MEVPAAILQVLKCDNCCEYLSCSPVYLTNKGSTFCGRCYASEEKQQDPARRILKYEAVAQLLKFPCKYNVHGCTETVPFARNYQEKSHEKVCEFRDYPCPIAEIGECDWLGQRKNLFGHFQSKHPSHVAKNPCHLRYDMTKFSTKTYIINCFNFIFVLHTKVCITSGKIYHAIKLLDKEDKIAQFKYTLEIKREELVISRPGKIVSHYCIGIDENTAIVTNISSLLDFLNNSSGTIFTIRIQKVEKNIPKPIKVVNNVSKPIKEAKQAVKESEKCVTLPKSPISTTVVNNDRYCRNKYQGCTFTDTEKKCDKHEKFFCSFRTWCSTCTSLPPVNITSKEAWHAHYLTDHKYNTYEGDKYINICATEGTGQRIYIKTNIGYVYCQYFLNSLVYRLWIWSSLPSKNLDKHRCVLNLKTGVVPCIHKSFVLDTQFTETWDWFIEVNRNSFPYWNSNDFEMSLQISK